MYPDTHERMPSKGTYSYAYADLALMQTRYTATQMRTLRSCKRSTRGRHHALGQVARRNAHAHAEPLRQCTRQLAAGWRARSRGGATGHTAAQHCGHSSKHVLRAATVRQGHHAQPGSEPHLLGFPCTGGSHRVHARLSRHPGVTRHATRLPPTHCFEAALFMPPEPPNAGLSRHLNLWPCSSCRVHLAAVPTEGHQHRVLRGADGEGAAEAYSLVDALRAGPPQGMQGAVSAQTPLCGPRACSRVRNCVHL
eukprot:365549-Chlamydomonas_euryale.AAC.8